MSDEKSDAISDNQAVAGTRTPEELKLASEQFITEYGELVRKHGIDFATYPVATPIPGVPGFFGLVMQNTPVDVMNQPMKSPFMAKE